MKKITFLIMVLTIFSKCLGFIRELVLSYTYGASATTDAYLVAIGIPSIYLTLLSLGFFLAIFRFTARLSIQKEGKMRINLPIP